MAYFITGLNTVQVLEEVNHRNIILFVIFLCDNNILLILLFAIAETSIKVGLGISLEYSILTNDLREKFIIIVL